MRRPRICFLIILLGSWNFGRGSKISERILSSNQNLNLICWLVIVVFNVGSGTLREDRVHGSDETLGLSKRKVLLLNLISFTFSMWQDNCHSGKTLFNLLLSFIISFLFIFKLDRTTAIVESEGARSFCTIVALVFHAVSPRPGLVKLLALSNFQARCEHLVSRVSPDISASFLWSLLISLSSVLPYLISDARSCHRYLEPNDCSAPILLLLLVHRRWLDSGMVFPSLTHSTTEANSFSNLFD